MGGHSAWRKRVANGELAKQGGGAICRHRPHLGRKGKDLIKNRKGFIGSGNPKKLKKYDAITDTITDEGLLTSSNRNLPVIVLGTTWAVVLLSFVAYFLTTTSRSRSILS